MVAFPSFLFKTTLNLFETMKKYMLLMKLPVAVASGVLPGNELLMVYFDTCTCSDRNI